MLKKTLFSLLAVVCLLAPAAAPVAADKPDMLVYTGTPFDYPVVDCTTYGYLGTIDNHWEFEDIFQTFYNKDGTIKYFLEHARMFHTFTNSVTGKSISAETRDNVIWQPEPGSTLGELRGRFQQIIIPGVGPIFADVGRKVFEFSWNPDGTLTFELLFNAGPATYMENNLEPLCAYLGTP